jgi:integrase
VKTRRPPLPKYVVEYEVPKGSGKWFVYFRRKGEKDIRMRGTPGTDDWNELYRALLAGERPVEKVGPQAPADGTLSWLCQQYMASSEFGALDERTRTIRRQILQHCVDEPTKPGGAILFGSLKVPQVTAKAISVLRDRKKDFPEAANARVKAIRAVFAWAGMPEVALVTTNPARDVQNRAPTNPGGFHSWTLEEVERFEARHPTGTKARLAMDLLLYTAQRRSDVVLFGRQHESNGWLRFTQQKNKRNKPVYLEIPIRPELRASIDASPTGDIVYLVNEFGNPFTANGFGNWFRKRCDEAGLPNCTAHGLRKAAAARLADAGATAHEIMAITGHKTMKEIERYTRAADQKRLAASASKRT